MTAGTEPLGNASRPDALGVDDDSGFSESDLLQRKLPDSSAWGEYLSYVKTITRHDFPRWQIACEWPLDQYNADGELNPVFQHCQLLINQGHSRECNLVDLSDRAFYAVRSAVGCVDRLLNQVWDATNQNTDMTKQLLYRAFGVLEDVWANGEHQPIKWHEVSMYRKLNRNSLNNLENIPHRAGIEFQRTEFGGMNLKVVPAVHLDQPYIQPVSVTVFEGGDSFTAMILVCLRGFHMAFGDLVKLLALSRGDNPSKAGVLWDKAASWLEKILYWQDRINWHERGQEHLENHRSKSIQEKIDVLLAVVEHHRDVAADEVPNQLKDTFGTEKCRAARSRANARVTAYRILQANQGAMNSRSELPLMLGIIINDGESFDRDTLIERWPGLFKSCIADAENKQNAASTNPDKQRWGGVVSLLNGVSSDYSMDVVHTAFGLLVGDQDPNVDSLRTALARARNTLKEWQENLAQEAKPLIEKMDGLLRKVVEPIIMGVKKG